MAFTDTQIQALSGKLSARHVRTRQAGEVLLLGQQMPEKNRELARGDHGGDLLATPGTGSVRVLKESGP